MSWLAYALVSAGERMLDCDNLSPKASEITLDIEGV